MARKTFQRGRFFEDFEVGAVYKHHWGRTLTYGENSLFSTWTMNMNPVHFNKEYARSLGFETTPCNPMLVLNVVIGMSVEDVSELALSSLGVWKLRYFLPVYPGDTLLAESEVLGRWAVEGKDDRGVVHVRTHGTNQREERVIELERQIEVKRRSHYGEGEVRR